MDFWTRLLGTSFTPQKPAKPANDTQTRHRRFKQVYNHIVELTERPRDLSSEDQLLSQLHTHLDRLATLLREETRAPVPHICFQYAASNRIYVLVGRVAFVSQWEPVIRSSISVFAALIDSEEEDFLSNAHFAKSLMQLVRKVAESGNILIDTETETNILELLFTIAAKIRLQPEILPVWFQSKAKPEQEDVFANEKKNFAGLTQKDDFPLCYLLIDRVHHEGRIGDFARTGLLYVFEATGRSAELENWVVQSDLPTLMASGLGALYSQLSRELSILHADAELPAVLAMSDYRTTHPRALAESAFGERHKAHMATFLSYLAFWQDVLDHCRSDEVKQTLLDHFQVLFLQQLLYPSLLQSSDTDAGSSVAVLTYMSAIMEALEYPDLLHNMLTYLLAIQDEDIPIAVSEPQTPAIANAPHRSPTSVRRRQSLMLLSAPKNPDDAVEPALFNLVDLIINNVSSQNSQSVFASLRLASTLLQRQKKYAFGTLLKVESSKHGTPTRTIGGLEQDLTEYAQVASSLHAHRSLGFSYSRLSEDMRDVIESQVPADIPGSATAHKEVANIGGYLISDNDSFMRNIQNLLGSFWTNSIDVNLALTQTVIVIAQCVEIRPDRWLALSASKYSFIDDDAGDTMRPWQACLGEEEKTEWLAVTEQLRRPTWIGTEAPMLHKQLKRLSSELEAVRQKVHNLDQLIAGRKDMLQATDASRTEPSPPSSVVGSPTQRSALLDVPEALRGGSRGSSRAGKGRSRHVESEASNVSIPGSGASSLAGSRSESRNASQPRNSKDLSSPSNGTSLFRPPPPETPSTTDVLMQLIAFPEPEHLERSSDNEIEVHVSPKADPGASLNERTASLNHVLTNVVVLQEFVLELAAALQVRAAILGEREVRIT